MPRLIWFFPFLAIGLTGCDLPFYWQATKGQLDLLQRRQEITALLDQDSTPTALKSELEYVLKVRDFALHELHLNVGANYTSYADLERPFVMWNVFATPALSMQNQQWCFPIAGCVPYRGYFAETDARAFASTLDQQGLDTYVGGVPAYSTLGWFDDAVLNTFIQLDSLSLAGLLFHELAHRTFYLPGDATFNESFATAVENIGLQRWIAINRLQALEPAYHLAKQRQEQFLALVLKNTEARQRLFDDAISEPEKALGKSTLQEQLRYEYAALKASWGGYDGYDRWFEGPLNNAQLSTVTTYHQLESGFIELYEQNGQDMPKFIAACRSLKEKDQESRHLYLNQLATGEIVYTQD